MEIHIIEMPADGTYRVSLDGEKMRGYLVKGPDGKFIVFPAGKSSQLRTRPQSREAAAMLLLFHHFTEERRTIDGRSTEVA